MGAKLSLDNTWCRQKSITGENGEILVFVKMCNGSVSYRLSINRTKLPQNLEAFISYKVY